jgi:hypothetical protein
MESQPSRRFSQRGLNLSVKRLVQSILAQSRSRSTMEPSFRSRQLVNSAFPRSRSQPPSRQTIVYESARKS